MIRFLISLFLFFLFLSVNAQNLIPNPSVEDYIDCPETLENIEGNVIPWQKFRGTPDYFNGCSENELLGHDNSMGFQNPSDGEAYLGLITYVSNLDDSREYFGVELAEPLIEGAQYTLSFKVSLAYSFKNANLATNNIGCLLMKENYLDVNEQGDILNFSHFNYNEILNDTSSWTELTYEFQADSAYQFIAFGNFFNDSNTTVISQISDQEFDVISYYFFDEFSLISTETNVPKSPNVHLNVFPNPTNGSINIEADIANIEEYAIYDIAGDLISKHSYNEPVREVRANLELSNGVYLLICQTQFGASTKRIILKN